LVVFCYIIASGLIFYGLLHPAFAIRRAIIAGAAICFTAFSVNQLSNSINQSSLVDLGFTEKTAKYVVMISQFLGNQNELPFWVILCCMGILSIIEVCRIAHPYILKLIDGKQLKLNHAQNAGAIVKHDNSELEAQHWVSISNETDNSISITSASMRIFWFKSFPAKLFYKAEGRPYSDEVTVYNALKVAKRRNVQLQITFDEFSNVFKKFINILRLSKLDIFLDLNIMIYIFTTDKKISLVVPYRLKK